MAGVKISELSKWSINEIQGIDSADILIPVSINTTTGALRANTLVQMLSEHAHEYYANEFYTELMNIKSQVTALDTALTGLQRNVVDLSARINELQAQQHEIDTAQTNAIDSHAESISDINAINVQQSTDIETLKEFHNWENYNGDNDQTPENNE